MAFLLDLISADAGGCWKARGRRLSGSSGAWLFGFQLEINGSNVTLNNGTILAGGDDNPEITDWKNCDYEYRLEYGDCGSSDCPASAFYVFKVDNCCPGCEVEGIVLDVLGCAIYISGYSNSCNQTSGQPINVWEYSEDGVTWTVVAGQTGTWIEATLTGYYRLKILNSVNGCVCYSNEIYVDCAGGCEGNLNITQGACTLTLNSAPCTNGTYQVIRTSTGNIMQSGTWNGTPIVYNVPSNGSYKFVVTCAGGCVYESTPVAFTGCEPPVCNCVPVLSLNGSNCTLNLSTTNCGGFNAIWQRSVNGTSGWATVQVGGTSHVPTTNQYYRVQMVDPSGACPNVNSNRVQVNCHPSCVCSASISGNGCLITLAHSCAGYTWTFQRSTNGISGWINVQAGGTSHLGLDGLFYRVVLTKSGCPSVTTNVVEAECAPECGCVISLGYNPTLCQLLVNFSEECADLGYSYQLQINTGSGWSAVVSGLVTNEGFLHSVGQNGTYRLVVFGGTGCPPLQSADVVVNCYPACGCSANISVTGCSLELFQSCIGYAWTWQQSDNGTSGWTNVQTGGLTYSGIAGKFYRVVLTKSGCSSVTTNVEEFEGCNAELDYIIPGNVTSGGEITTIVGCEGYTWKWQWFNNSSVWVDAPGGSNVMQYFPPFELCTERFRVIFSKPGCPDFIAWRAGNPIQLNCA